MGIINSLSLSIRRMDSSQTYTLITGGVGYIGSHTVVDLVERGDKIVIVDNLDNSNIKCLDRLREITKVEDAIIFHEIDIKNEEKMEKEVFQKYKFNACIHFAAYKAVGESISKPLDYYNNNVCGSITLLRLIQKYAVKCFVFSSSATVYGENPQCVEQDKIQPINPYGQTKAMIE